MPESNSTKIKRVVGFSGGADSHFDPEWFRGLIHHVKSRGKPPIIEVCWGDMAYTFRDEDEIARYGRDNRLAFCLVVTRNFRKCFVMEAP